MFPQLINFDLPAHSRLAIRPGTPGVVPVPGLALWTVPMCSFARRDVRHVHQHRLGGVHVEHLAPLGHFRKRCAGLAGT